MPAWSLLAAVLLSCSPAARPIVAEVYYDAPGDDTGFEFVELLNTGDAPASLAGLRLEAGDGAGPGRWTLRWTGRAVDSVHAHARFVVGGARVSPPPDALVTLDLQNGPDALRLVWPDGATEVVGWGALDLPEYRCGESAPDVAAGQSLARVPDAAQSGANGSDFRAAAPSPGAPNQRARDASRVRHSLALVPELPAALAPITLNGAVVNSGALAWGEGECALSVEGELLAAPLVASLGAVAPGDTLRWSLPCEGLRAGRGELVARVALVGDESSLDDADTLLVRAGPGPLEVTEIQFHPAAREGEWIEVRNASGDWLDLDNLLVGDRGGAHGLIEAGAALAPDSLALLAQDPAALLLAWPGLDPTRVRAVAPWASFNNSDDATGVADQVRLDEGDGVPVARVAYSASGVGTGATLELDDGAWRPSAAPGGTPLAPPPPRESVPGGLRVSPRRLRAQGETLHFAWELPWPEARVVLELYDLEGRRTRRLAGPLASGARGERPVSLDPLVPGVYLAVLRAESGAQSLTRVTAVRVDGDAR